MVTLVCGRQPLAQHGFQSPRFGKGSGVGKLALERKRPRLPFS